MKETHCTSAMRQKISSGRVFSTILASGMFEGHCLGVVVSASQQEAQIMIRLLRTQLPCLPDAYSLHIQSLIFTLNHSNPCWVQTSNNCNTQKKRKRQTVRERGSPVSFSTVSAHPIKMPHCFSSGDFFIAAGTYCCLGCSLNPFPEENGRGMEEN